MGLDSYIVVKDSDDDSECVSYWGKNWTIHEFFAEYYDGKDEFNCQEVDIDMSMLQQLKDDLIHDIVLNMKSDSDDGPSSYSVYELNKAIRYLKDNPDKQLIYYGWY